MAPQCPEPCQIRNREYWIRQNIADRNSFSFACDGRSPDTDGGGADHSAGGAYGPGTATRESCLFPAPSYRHGHMFGDPQSRSALRSMKQAWCLVQELAHAAAALPTGCRPKEAVNPIPPADMEPRRDQSLSHAQRLKKKEKDVGRYASTTWSMRKIQDTQITPTTYYRTGIQCLQNIARSL